MDLTVTVPVWFDKPLNVWLGLVLLPLLVAQITSGIILWRGRYGIFFLHRLNAFFLAVIVAVHAFYGIGIWFFDFKIG